MDKFLKIIRQIGFFFGLFITGAVIIILFIGVMGFVDDLGHHIYETRNRERKYERMQYVKDSLTVEALKRKLEIYEKDSTERRNP